MLYDFIYMTWRIHSFPLKYRIKSQANAAKPFLKNNKLEIIQGKYF